jgi:hypothetical protein
MRNNGGAMAAVNMKKPKGGGNQFGNTITSLSDPTQAIILNQSKVIINISSMKLLRDN